MDGNGRWAKGRGLPRTAGHAAGAETFRAIATHCKNRGIPYLTVYAFSTENWNRPSAEVAAIMSLLETYLGEAIAKMAQDRIKLRFLGDLSPLSPKLRALCRETDLIARAYAPEITVNICLNYGGRDEILRGAQAFARDCLHGRKAPEDCTAEEFGDYLYSAGLPDPDLIIRPSGELRISNFLLWQSAYAEYYFTDTLWPDFDEGALDAALAAYQNRNRRFGRI
jgi:undecaprenyl diphosphate synthase